MPLKQLSDESQEMENYDDNFDIVESQVKPLRLLDLSALRVKSNSFS